MGRRTQRGMRRLEQTVGGEEHRLGGDAFLGYGTVKVGCTQVFKALGSHARVLRRKTLMRHGADQRGERAV